MSDIKTIIGVLFLLGFAIGLIVYISIILKAKPTEKFNIATTRYDDAKFLDDRREVQEKAILENNSNTLSGTTLSGCPLTTMQQLDNYAQTNLFTGDYLSVSPNRNMYYQRNMGYMGENILSGYPYFLNRSL
jgi:hypothetical protein